MNATVLRPLIAHGVILMGVCTGAWIMLVQPKERLLAKLETSIAESERGAAQAAPDVVERLVNQRSTLAARVRRIAMRNQFASDSSEMYRRLTTLADRCGVIVQRISPGAVKNRSLENDASAQSTNFDVTIEGSFDQIANYLHEIDRIDGFIRPESLTLSPREISGQLIVEARFSCEALSFEIPDALLAMTEGSADDE